MIKLLIKQFINYEGKNGYEVIYCGKTEYGA